MVRREQSVFGRLFGGSRTPSAREEREQLRRVEEKRRSAAEATRQWLTLLRELENNGESGRSTYESYYQAYLQAREQEKRVELELFNLRQGLSR